MRIRRRLLRLTLNNLNTKDFQDDFGTVMFQTRSHERQQYEQLFRDQSLFPNLAFGIVAAWFKQGGHSEVEDEGTPLSIHPLLISDRQKIVNELRLRQRHDQSSNRTSIHWFLAAGIRCEQCGQLVRKTWTRDSESLADDAYFGTFNPLVDSTVPKPAVFHNTMPAIMITSWSFFFFKEFRQRVTGIRQKTPELRWSDHNDFLAAFFREYFW